MQAQINMAKKKLSSMIPASKPIITALYCCDEGHPASSQHLYDVNKEELFDKYEYGEQTVSLYKKLLLQRPSRQRKLINDYRDIASDRSPKTKFHRFREGSLAWMQNTAEGLLRNAGLTAKDIDILVVNYMAGKTLPSLSALLANKMGFRQDILSYNLGDMGCSAAVASIDLALRVLQSESSPKRAMIIALEPVTTLFQNTDSPGGIVGNTLFGDGCAGLVLSTHKEPALYHIGPTQRILRSDDEGIEAIKLVYGPDGPMIQLSKKIGEVAGEAIQANLKRLVPRILPTSDKLKFLATRKVPRWQRHIDHWALHPGGIRVLQGLEKSLKLAEADLGASYRVFQERSNMSSPSVFYVLENIERTTPRPGDKVLMFGFGSGFKANSVVLTKGEKRHSVAPEHNAVVIGGTSGIGLEAVRKLQHDGYRVFVGSRRVGKPDSEWEKIPGVTYLPLDVTDPESVQAFSDAVWEKTFGVDALIVSSGVSQTPSATGRMDPVETQRTIDTNLTGAIHVVNAFLPRIRQNGAVVLVNSILGQIPLMNNSVYCATKAGLKHFAESVEIEVRRTGRNINVHSMYPAYVDTPLLDNVREKGKLMFKPITTKQALSQLDEVLQKNREHHGFALPRDRAIAELYRLLPNIFKQIVSAM